MHFFTADQHYGHANIIRHALRTWPRSHYNSWQLHGHSHGTLEPIGKQWDVGVDHNDFAPVSFARIRAIMDERPDNPGYVAQTPAKGGRL